MRRTHRLVMRASTASHTASGAVFRAGQSSSDNPAAMSPSRLGQRAINCTKTRCDSRSPSFRSNKSVGGQLNHLRNLPHQPWQGTRVAWIEFSDSFLSRSDSDAIPVLDGEICRSPPSSFLPHATPAGRLLQPRPIVCLVRCSGMRRADAVAIVKQLEPSLREQGVSARRQSGI